MELLPEEKWVFGLLSADTTLQGLLAPSVIPGDLCAVYHRKGPQGAMYPMILFGIQSAQDVNAMGGRKAVDTVVAVWVEGETQSTYSLATIANRMDALLSGAASASEGSVGIQPCFRESSFDEPGERAGGKEYRMVGGMYRVYLTI